MVDRNRLNKYLDELGINELNHIKKLREELGLSVDDLAKICSLSVGTISTVENQIHIPNQITIFLICRGFKKLGINPHNIFTFY